MEDFFPLKKNGNSFSLEQERKKIKEENSGYSFVIVIVFLYEFFTGVIFLFVLLFYANFDDHFMMYKLISLFVKCSFCFKKKNEKQKKGVIEYVQKKIPIYAT